MDKKLLENIIKYELKPDETITDIELFVNLEMDWVVKYTQNGTRKLLAIDYLEEDNNEQD